jgi:hypothetical protein
LRALAPVGRDRGLVHEPDIVRIGEPGEVLRSLEQKQEKLRVVRMGEQRFLERLRSLRSERFIGAAHYRRK